MAEQSNRSFDECRDELRNRLLEQFHRLLESGEAAIETPIAVEEGGWQISLDHRVVPVRSSEIHYTRLRAPFTRSDGFRFRVYRKTLLSFVGVWLGMQDVEIGSEEFDDQFVVQGNHRGKIFALFSNTHLRELLTEQSGVQLALSDDDGWWATGAAHSSNADARAPSHLAQLCLETSDQIQDETELLNLYNLFAETLSQLNRVTSP